MKKFIKSNFSNRNNGDSKDTDFNDNLEFSDFVDYSAVGIFKLDMNTNIEFANQALAQILDYKSRSDLFGINFQDELVSESTDWEKIRSKLYKHRIAKNHIMPLKQNSGASIFVRIDMRTASDESGNPLFFEGSVTDVSEFVKNEMRIKKELEVLRSEKNLPPSVESQPEIDSKYLTDLANKIKFPINSIVGFFTLIEQGLFNSEEELKDFSKKAKLSANSLLGIADGINTKVSEIPAKTSPEKTVDDSIHELNDESIEEEVIEEEVVDEPAKIEEKVVDEPDTIEEDEELEEETVIDEISVEAKDNGNGKASLIPHTKILLVEDNPISTNVEMRLLRESGYSVVAVKNGGDAVAAVKTNEFSLVLMDVEMPDMDGIKATQIIRDLEAPINRIPIIAVTAHSSMKDREKCLASGMNDYIAKPININFMRMTIDQWLKRKVVS